MVYDPNAELQSATGDINPYYAAMLKSKMAGTDDFEDNMTAAQRFVGAQEASGPLGPSKATSAEQVLGGIQQASDLAQKGQTLYNFGDKIFGGASAVPSFVNPANLSGVEPMAGGAVVPEVAPMAAGLAPMLMALPGLAALIMTQFVDKNTSKQDFERAAGYLVEDPSRIDPSLSSLEKQVETPYTPGQVGSNPYLFSGFEQEAFNALDQLGGLTQEQRDRFGGLQRENERRLQDAAAFQQTVGGR